MKKILLLLALLSLSSCLSIEEVLESETGCCRIVVYSDHVRYEEDGYHTTEWYDNEVVKDQLINQYFEYCYHYHYQPE